MKILVLNGSPRPKGGTAAMIKAFIEGTKSVGHQVDVLDIARMDIRGCQACEHCHSTGKGTWIQQDDMNLVYPLWDNADMIVLASPIYYGSFSGQLHCLIHRTYAGGIPRSCKQMALLLCSGAQDVYDYAEGIYHGFIQGYFRVKDCGIFKATTTYAKSPEMAKQLRNFGASL